MGGSLLTVQKGGYMRQRLVNAVKWKDFYILRIWKIAFVWITKAEHTHPEKYIEVWNSNHAIALIIGRYGIGVGMLLE